MKPSYVDELKLLASSYAWASREDISPLTQLLDTVASGTALYIGSGGALAVSALASVLHVAKTGRLATHVTPLAVSGGPLRHFTAAVLFSARAGNPDVALAARAAVEQGCNPVGLVTHRRVEEIPSSLARQPITIVSYAAPFTRDGFLATNSVLTDVDIARALVHKARLLVVGSATAADISGRPLYDQELPCLSWSRYVGCWYRPRDASLRDRACGSSAR
jgi:hypothetical protein